MTFNIIQRIMSRRRTRLNTVAEVIDALGERKADAADLLCVSRSMISHMLADNQIPRVHHRRIELYLSHLGYEIDGEAVFGESIDTILEDLRGHKEVGNVLTAA